MDSEAIPEFQRRDPSNLVRAIESKYHRNENDREAQRRHRNRFRAFR